jgi:hypothetical protein
MHQKERHEDISGEGYQGCGSEMFIPDPNFFHPEYRIPDPGSKRFLEPGSGFASKNLGFLPIPDPRSMGQKGIGSRIPDPQH